MAQPRDSQRKKLYTAEWDVFNPDRTALTPDFTTLREAQQFVNRTVASPFWKKTCSRRQVTVKNEGRVWARGYRYFITAPAITWLRWILLHELAHVWIQNVHSKELPGHGPDFVMVYRRLLEIEYGQETLKQFDASCERQGVRWTNASQRTIGALAPAASL